MKTFVSHTARYAVLAVLAVVLQSVAAGDVYSQALPSNVSVGFKVGMTTSTLTGDAVNDAGWKSGFGGGLFARYHLTSVFSVQPELLFTMKGADLDEEIQGIENENGNGQESSYEFGYLEIPLLLKVSAPVHSPVRPNVFAGPVLSIKLYGEIEDQDLDDQLRSTDWGITAGAGVDFAGFGRRAITVDGRYTWGLTDVFDVTGDPEARNEAVTVTIGFGL